MMVVNTETLKDNPALRQGAGRRLVRDDGADASGTPRRPGRQGGDGQGLGHRPRRLRRAARLDRRCSTTPAKAVDVHQGRRAAEDHGPRAQLPVRPRHPRHQRGERRHGRHRASPTARRWATPANVKLRFDPAFMAEAAAGGALTQRACWPRASAHERAAQGERRCAPRRAAEAAPSPGQRAAGARRRLVLGALPFVAVGDRLSGRLGRTAGRQPERQAAALARADVVGLAASWPSCRTSARGDLILLGRHLRQPAAAARRRRRRRRSRRWCSASPSASSRASGRSLLPFVAVVCVIPPLALLPILFIALGLGEAAKITLIAVGIAPGHGARHRQPRRCELPPELLAKAQTLGASTAGQMVLRRRAAADPAAAAHLRAAGARPGLAVPDRGRGDRLDRGAGLPHLPGPPLPRRWT